HPAGPEAEMAAATSLSSAGAWPLRRYGRFVRPDPPHGHAATVLESNEESGHLILTIVVSGHFFISQGRTVLNECRMFRVQFDGDSKEQAVEHCCNCVQKLAEYVTVQVTDEQSQELQGQSQFLDSENQVQQNASIPPGVSGSVLNSKSELPHVYQHCVWSAKDLGPFIRLCLMDQNFPAFVEEVEKELKKLTEG
uniref:REC114 meiotic recombination protein n=1 Tax=Crocodylus porosus TaxID=8502 RepID=A0A7M4EH32_CROPO